MFFGKYLHRVFVCFFLLLSSFLTAQENPPKKLKVGLVLSGGGTKGFAHIGVLRQIEKAGISLDMVGGTSMGAVVAALYASGYSVDQIEKIFMQLDYDAFVNDRMPRAQASLFAKEREHRYLYSLGFSKKGIHLPKAVSKGQNPYDFLKFHFSHVDTIQDFSKLKIPFYCVATNLETGALTVFDKGDLAQSLRASASLPTLFEPMRIGESIYIDGGVSDNFPVMEMRNRDIDIIIGVDAQGTLYKRERIKDVVDLLDQIISFQMYSRNEFKKKQVDVYIRPLVSDYGVQDFKALQKIIDLGEEEAKYQFEALKNIGKKQQLANQTHFSPQKDLKVEEKKYTISTFESSFLKYYSRSYLLGRLRLQLGDKVSLSEWIYKLHTLSLEDNFSLIQYKFKKNKTTNDYSLNLNLMEQENRNVLKFGLMYDPLYGGSVLINTTFKSLLQKNDILSLDFLIGDTPRAEIDYFVDNGFYISYGFKSRYNNFLQKNVSYSYPDDERNWKQAYINKNFMDVTNLVYCQTIYNKIFAFGVGIEHKYLAEYTMSLNTDDPQDWRTFFENTNYFSALTYLKLDTYDRPYLPKKGFYTNLELKYYAASSGKFNGKHADAKKFSPFMTLNGHVGFAHTEGKWTLHAQGFAGTVITENAIPQFKYHLGGAIPYNYNNYISVYGYQFDEVIADAYFKILSELRYEVFKNHDISFYCNYVKSIRQLESIQGISEDLISRNYIDVAISYTYHSVVGPISIVKHAQDFFIRVGYSF